MLLGGGAVCRLSRGLLLATIGTPTAYTPDHAVWRWCAVRGRNGGLIHISHARHPEGWWGITVRLWYIGAMVPLHERRRTRPPRRTSTLPMHIRPRRIKHELVGRGASTAISKASSAYHIT